MCNFSIRSSLYYVGISNSTYKVSNSQSCVFSDRPPDGFQLVMMAGEAELPVCVLVLHRTMLKQFPPPP